MISRFVYTGAYSLCGRNYAPVNQRLDIRPVWVRVGVDSVESRYLADIAVSQLVEAARFNDSNRYSWIFGEMFGYGKFRRTSSDDLWSVSFV